MSKEILSQEEIDALLKTEKEDSVELTDQEKDVIGEVGNISMGAAATVLNQIVDREVSITTPEVSLLAVDDLSQQYERPCVVVEVEYLSFLEGRNLLVVKERDAAIIVDLMMGGDGTNPPKEIGELQLSAIGEAMNQMMGASATTLSQIFNSAINITPPNIEYLSLEEKIREETFLGGEKTVVSILFRMSVADLIDSTIMMVASLPFLKNMVQKLVEGQLSLIDSEGGKVVAAEDLPEQAAQEAEKEPVEKAPVPKAEKQKPEKKSQHKVEPQVEVEQASFESFDEGEEKERFDSIDLLSDIPLNVTVRLGKTQMTIREILELGKGSIIELDRLAGEDVDLLVNGKLIAKGEVVVIEENFAFRVKKIVSPMERIKDL